MTKPLFDLVENDYLVPFDGGIQHEHCATTPPPGTASKGELKDRLLDQAKRLDDLQRLLYAHDRHPVLLIFQALDAAGKDSTIRAVFRRVDPAGLHVSSFKAPSKKELEHDFLWRTTRQLPERGSIGVFNRSYYEEVLVVRVHPEYLGGQRLPPHDSLDALWQQRYQSIRDFETHLARSGTVVLKFWLKHSRDEQRNRFLARLDTPEKRWKFSKGDVVERGHWDEYMTVYQEAVNATSTRHAPWYVIPADDKPFMRCTVADIVIQTLSSMNMTYPEVAPDELAEHADLRAQLLAD